VQNNEQTINQLQPEDQERWFDLRTGMEMSRGEFIQKIEAGEYPGYYVIAQPGGGIPSPGLNADVNELD